MLRILEGIRLKIKNTNWSEKMNFWHLEVDTNKNNGIY
jgi:hypothetical protein